MTAAARRALSSVVQFFTGKSPARQEDNEEEHRVGEYIADYSEVTVAQLQEPQPELDELFKDSKIVSVKREP
jgi:hypothetical protein